MKTLKDIEAQITYQYTLINRWNDDIMNAQDKINDLEEERVNLINSINAVRDFATRK